MTTGFYRISPNNKKREGESLMGAGVVNYGVEHRVNDRLKGMNLQKQWCVMEHEEKRLWGCSKARSFTNDCRVSLGPGWTEAE